MVEIAKVVQIIAQLLPGWDVYSGSPSKWMLDEGVCNHDDGCFCQHRQQHFLKLIEKELNKKVGDGKRT